MSAVVYLLLAACVGLLAGRVVPSRAPYATIVCAVAALVASVTVSLPLGDRGPHLFQVALPPAAAGATIGALTARVLLGRALAHWD